MDCKNSISIEVKTGSYATTEACIVRTVEIKWLHSLFSSIQGVMQVGLRIFASHGPRRQQDFRVQGRQFFQGKAPLLATLG
jgi:hypothetical protein